MMLRKWEYQSYFSTNQSSEKLTALQLFWQNSSVITNSWTKCFETSLKSQIFPIHKYIFMNGKSQYPVFFKNHAAVTPELVVNRLRRINTYIWLFNKSYLSTQMSICAENVWKYWAATRRNKNIWTLVQLGTNIWTLPNW